MLLKKINLKVNRMISIYDKKRVLECKIFGYLLIKLIYFDMIAYA